MNISGIDVAIVIAYIILIVAVGLYMERRAGKNIETYFLGGSNTHWLLLGMSGSSTYFDITGTMWMVSVFYVLGMRGMWEHCFWGFPVAGFVLAYKAKWAYRSGVLTGMEWLVFRYGRQRAGQAARFITVIVNLTIMVFMLGYAGIGVGKFMEEFLPIPRSLGVPLLFAVTGLYVILGGFFSVIYSDLFQTILLSFAAVYIAVAAFLQIDPETFRQTISDDWLSLVPVWKLDNPPEHYADPFGLLVMLWMTKGFVVLLGASGGGIDFQRFRAARSEADACKVGLAWGLVISVRWGLVMGFTAFGLSILADQGGVIDSERVLPMVLNRVLPVGVKGLVLAGLIAAFMSTFDSTLNVAASFVVNDLIKPRWKNATPKALMRLSYIATFAIVLLGIVISLRTERIAAIWKPVNFALGAALLVPMLLAPYWWRIGGWAHCTTGLCTLPAAVWVKLFRPEWNALRYFPLLVGVGLVSCLLGACLFPHAPNETLKSFYRKVRPFGFWGPVRKMIADDGDDPRRFPRDRLDIPVALVGTAFFVVLYLLVMDTVLHNWSRAAWLLPATAATGAFLYFAWWRPLDRHDQVR